MVYCKHCRRDEDRRPEDPLIRLDTTSAAFWRHKRRGALLDSPCYSRLGNFLVVYSQSLVYIEAKVGVRVVSRDRFIREIIVKIMRLHISIDNPP